MYHSTAANVLRHSSFLLDLNRKLKDDWSANVAQDGRIFYFNHATQTSSWLPPADNWDAKTSGFPYGWEMAIDKDGKEYFINHLNKTTTYEDPRKEVVEEPPKPREVELFRDSEMGFGFVAGSEKPVIVRFVTEGGPSTGKLLPGDQILRVNGEDVKRAPRDHVIELVRACKQSVLLSVCQPETNNSTRKSALLSAAKKARLKSNPSRVRFAEGVTINGSPLFSMSNFSSESCIPFMPNVLKVFLENGQTKSFKYDSSTLVQDVVESLQQKLSIKCPEHFSLVVEHIKSLRRNKLTLLDPKESLAKIAARPGVQHLRCLFRVTFVPKDAYELLKKDPVTFEYLYMQCCNDVVQERFAPELKYDIALRLAALHTQQHALSSLSSQSNKISIKAVERECGLEKFVPVSLMETMKRKELRKLLGHFLKLNQGLSAPGQKTLTALQAKLHYLRIISELPSYGSKCFSTNLRDSNVETVILVSPKFGISQISGIRNSVPITLADIEDLSGVVVNREDEFSHQMELQMKDPDRENILLSLEGRDSEELVLLLEGYYRLLSNRPLPVQQEKDRWSEDAAPPYHTRHTVQTAGWNYMDDQTTDVVDKEVLDHQTDPSSVDTVRCVDLACSPPPYQQNKTLTANGHVATGEFGRNDTNSSPTCHNRVLLPLCDPTTVDRNMNSTVYSRDEATVTSTTVNAVTDEEAWKQVAALVPFTSDFRHVVEKEIKDVPCRLNREVEVSSSSSSSSVACRKTESCDNLDVTSVTAVPPVESKSEEAIRRVAEMQQIVLDAEMYLTEEEGTDTDHESSRGESAQSDVEGLSKLKAADSLLLLTQVGRDFEICEAVKSIGLVENEPSESDTDSMSTPTDSPSHRPDKKKLLRPQPSSILKSGSSFGLHSPDTLPPETKLERANLQDLLQRLQESQLPYPFAEGTLYLDPDIIDLTMIPPPITPDQEEAPTPVSFPPTPFADRLSLEAELSHGLLTMNPITLKLLKGPHAFEGGLCHGCLPTGHDVTTTGSGSANWTTNEDIDRFIASVTVPPPPCLGTFTFDDRFSVQELTQEEISAFIIPPPPASSSSDSESEMISRLQTAAAKVKRMVERHEDKTMIEAEHSKEDGGGAGDEEEQKDRSLTEIQAPIDVKSVTSDMAELPPRSFLFQHCDNSSGYETYASSSAISSLEVKQRRLLNNSFSDNSSTVSGSSSEVAGSQADTEDNTVDGDVGSSSPLLGVLRPVVTTKKNSSGTAVVDDASRKNGIQPRNHHQVTLSGSSNGISQASHHHLPNGVVRTGNGRSIVVTHHSRYPSTSSDDGAVSVAEAAASSRRQPSNIPRHHGSSTLTRKSSRTSDTLNNRIQKNRSSSNDNLNQTDDATEIGFLTMATVVDGLDNRRQWSSSIEDLATAAATAATERRITSPRSPCKRFPSAKHNSYDSSNTGTILKSPNGSRTRSGSNGACKPSTQTSVFQEVKQRTVSPSVTERKNRNDVNHVLVTKQVTTEKKIKVVSNCETSKLLRNGNISTSVRNSPSKLPRSKSSVTENNRKDGADQSDRTNRHNTNNNNQDSSSTKRTRNTLGTPVCQRDRRDSFYGAEEAIGNMLVCLDEVLCQCAKGITVSVNNGASHDQLVAARDALVSASKQFVTASKLFVKGATESEERLVECLVHCLALLDQMFVSTEQLARFTTSPLQMQNLVLKVKDVAFTFLQTLQAASNAVGMEINDSSINLLMQQATTLAAVLTSLMRTLRVFNL